MKHLKSILVLVMCLLIVGGSCVFAKDYNTTITINEDGTFAGYQIMTSTDDGNGRYAYYVNTKYEGFLKSLLGLSGTATSKEIVDKLATYTDDATQIRPFVDRFYRVVKAAGITPDKTFTGKNATTVTQGYWLIVDQTDLSGQADVDSIAMLDTAGTSGVTINTKKGDIPVIEKKIVIGTETKDVTDASENDIVKFQVKGTMPTKVSSYGNMHYEFEDEMGTGFDFINSGIKVYIGDQDVTSSFTVTQTGQKVNIKCDDIMKISGVTVTKDTIVKAEYSMKVNSSAVVGGDGNPNSCSVIYTNDPYGTNTGKTLADTVKVYTFQTTVNKTDTEGAALKGAGFTLYKKVGSTYSEIETLSGDVSSFEFKRLGDGEYKLSETTVPDGYYKAKDVEFTIESTFNETTDLKTKTLEFDPDTYFTVDTANGIGTITIQNAYVTKAPLTGRKGTLIFYAIGGLCIGAAILMKISRDKRQTGK